LIRSEYLFRINFVNKNEWRYSYFYKWASYCMQWECEIGYWAKKHNSP